MSPSANGAIRECGPRTTAPASVATIPTAREIRQNKNDPRSCHECAHYECLGDEHMNEGGRVGQCLLARERYGGDLTVGWNAPACKGFESKEPKYRSGRHK